MNPIRSWSFSRWDQLRTCGAQFKYAQIEKRPVAQKDYLAKGSRVHKALEDAIKFRDPRYLTHEIKKELDFVGELIESDAPRRVEHAINLGPGWSMGANYKTAWFRSKIDVDIEYDPAAAEIIDWKTGKKYDDSTRTADQMDLYAFLKFHTSSVYDITTRLVYVEFGGQQLKDYTRENDYEPLRMLWDKRATEFFSETEFRPRPGDHCRRCDFNKASGGPCRYG